MRLIKNFLKFLGVVFLLITILVIAINFWLHTESGRNIIADFVKESTKNATGEDDLELNIKNLQISFPLTATIDNINISSKNKIIANIDNLRLSLIPFISFSSKKLHIFRIPNLSTNKKNTSDSSMSFIPDIAISNFDIEEIIIDPKITNLTDDLLLSLNSNIELGNNANNVKLRLTSNIKSPRPEISGDHEIEISGDFNFDNNTHKIKLLKFQSDISEITGSLLVSENKLSGDLKYSTIILEKILSGSIPDVKASLSGGIDLSGSFDKQKLNLSGNVIIDLPKNDYLQLMPLSWSSDIIVNNGNLDGSISMNQGAIFAEGKIGYKNSSIYFHDFNATAPNFIKTAHIDFDTKTYLIRGSVIAKDKNLQESSKYFPFLKSGAFEVETKYFSTDNKLQSVNIKGRAKQLKTSFGNCSLMSIDANSSDLWGMQLSDSRISATYINVNDVVLDKIAINANSKNNEIYANGLIKTHKPYNINLEFDSKFSQNLNNYTAIISKLSGELNDNIVKNSKNILINFGSDISYHVNDLQIGDGFINLKGSSDHNKIDSISVFEDIPASIFSNFLPNNFTESFVSGDINLSGTLLSPVAHTNIKVENIKLANTIAKNKISIINLRASGDITGSKMEINTHLLEKEKTIAHSNLTLPITFTLLPFIFEINDTKEFYGNLKTDSSVNLLPLLPYASDYISQGFVDANIQANGSLNSLKLSGTLSLMEGKYRDNNYGVNLKNIAVDMEAKGVEVVFDKISANDNFKNTVSANGFLSLQGKNPFEFKINTDKIHLVNSKYFQGDIEGSILIKGNQEKAVAKGYINIGPMDITIPQKFNDNIPELNIIEVIEENDTQIQEQDNPYKLYLNIAAETQKNVYIRGWGVNSLLKGKVDIKGFAHKPMILGEFNSSHGTYQEFGKLLQVKKGQVIFDGDLEPNVEIIGTSTVDSTDISLILSGVITNPNISIESKPSMDDQEALSLLLFGKNVKSISPPQAFQLASSIRRLSGNGSNFDPLDIGRKLLSVDEINIRNDEDDPGKTVVGVGKHLTDKVFLEVEQGKKEGAVKTTIEVQVTPKISIENTTEAEGNSSVGVKWKFDY